MSLSDLSDTMRGVIDPGSPGAVRRAFGISLSACLDEVIVNGARIAAVHPESIHQVRIAGRRLQSVLRLFRSVQPKQADRLRRKLNWLMDETGPAREMDTLIADILKPAMVGESVPAFARLAYQRALVIREKAYRRAGRAFSSPEYERLVDEIRQMSRSGKLSTIGDESIETLVARILSEMRDQLKAAKPIERLKNSQLHKLRLRAKRMRYCAEVARFLVSRKKMRSDLDDILASLSRLQSELGAINDMVTHRDAMRRLVSERKQADHSTRKKRLRYFFPKQRRRRQASLKRASRAYSGVMKCSKKLS